MLIPIGLVLNKDRKHFDSKGLSVFFLGVKKQHLWFLFAIQVHLEYYYFISIFFLKTLILLSFESNAMEIVINIHHPHSVLSLKQNTKKLMNVKNQYKQYILKNVKREGKICSVFCTSKKAHTSNVML